MLVDRRGDRMHSSCKPRSRKQLVPRAAAGADAGTGAAHRAGDPGGAERAWPAGASSRSQIPWRGWKDILLRTYDEFEQDRLLALAAGVAFYSLLALFPAIAAGVSVYAFFADAATIGKHLSVATDIVPTVTLDLLTSEISRMAAKSDGRLTFGFVVGLAIACGAPMPG